MVFIKRGGTPLATTWIKPIKKNTSQTAATTIKASLDYILNPDKTNENLVSTHECDYHTAASEFLLANKIYEEQTGRLTSTKDVLMFHIRQSFKPGEVEPEKANEIGHELATRFTKGNHPFVVVTHTDKEHIHNHIMFQAVNHDATKKFKDPYLSAKIIRRISDQLCLESGLSVIENPQLSNETYRDWENKNQKPQKMNARKQLESTIDEILATRPKDFSKFIEALKLEGYEYNEKRKSVKGVNQKGSLRFNSLADGYKIEDIKNKLTEPTIEEHDLDEKGKEKYIDFNGVDLPHVGSNVQDELIQMFNSSGKSKPKINLLIRLENEIIAKQTNAGYQQWAKNFNVKQAANTLLFLQENNLTEFEKIDIELQNSKDKFNSISTKIKSLDNELENISNTQKKIGTYMKTKTVYDQWIKDGGKKSFYNSNKQIIDQHIAIKKNLNEQGGLKKIKDLQTDYAKKTVEKKKLYGERNQTRKHMQDILKAKQNVQDILGRQNTSKEHER